jgi:hypothetical protein
LEKVSLFGGDVFLLKRKRGRQHFLTLPLAEEFTGARFPLAADDPITRKII